VCTYRIKRTVSLLSDSVCLHAQLLRTSLNLFDNLSVVYTCLFDVRLFEGDLKIPKHVGVLVDCM
jgi:hypothetical protein